MMNELSILGELMEEPQSGYDLSSAMQSSLGPHRKISYGVIYPLLQKLEKEGLAKTTNANSDGKIKKITTITEKGKERFLKLMKMPVPNSAHNADIYLIKLDAMQHLTLDEQMKLLDDFYKEQKYIIEDTKNLLKILAKKKSKDHWYASKKLKLRLEQASTALEWIENFKEELKKKEW
ncbi:MAG: PadR family transcriptional regulator [Clostridium sp.]|nr:PadR family transcriptional regulator [Clostridium sp.]